VEQTIIRHQALPDGRIRLERPAEATLDFGFRIVRGDGHVWDISDFPERQILPLRRGQEERYGYVFRNDALQVTLELILPEDKGYAEWRLRLRNEGDDPLVLSAAHLCEGQLRCAATRAIEDESGIGTGEIGDGIGAGRVGAGGGVGATAAGRDWLALNVGLQSTDMHIGIEAVEPGRNHYFDGFTVLHEPTLNQHLLIGCSSHATYFPHVLARQDANNEGFDICLANQLENLVLRSGETADTEWAIFMTDHGHDRLLSRYMDRVCAAMKPASAFREPVTGWISWYYYYGTVTEQAVLDNVRALLEFPDIQPEYVVVDAGWFLETGFGDWEANGKFPHGMEWLAARIAEAGFKPGLWFSPLLADAGSQLVNEHPDWLLWRDGQPVAGMNPNGSDVLELHEKSNIKYVLDITNPEVLQYLHRLIHRAVHEWGYRYIKLDFLVRALFTDKGTHSSLERDQVYYPGTTTARAYRNAMRVIREAAGDQCFILGCAAPLFASLGPYIDANRMTPDITRRTYTASQERPGYWELVKICAQAMAARYFLHPRAGFNDPDALVVRGHEPEGIVDDYTPTLDEARVWAGVVALSGGLLFYNDKLSELEEERRPLISQLFPVGPGVAVPLDYFNPDIPRFWKLSIEDNGRRWSVLGVFNWSDAPDAPSLPLQELGFHQEEQVIGWSLWDRQETALLSDDAVDAQLSLHEIKPHSMQLLALRAAAGHPHLAGTDMHFTQGWAEFGDERWDAAERRLILQWRPGYTKRGTVYVHIPESYRRAVKSSNAVIADDGGDIVVLHCSGCTEPLLWIAFD
jgi:hypothetical protein